MSELDAGQGKGSAGSTQSGSLAQHNQRLGPHPGKGTRRARLGGRVGPRDRTVGADEAVSGPLRPGMHVTSGRLEIWQVSAERTEIELDLQRVTIEGEMYRFFVDRQASPRQRVVRIAATPGVSIQRQRRAGPLPPAAMDGELELVVHERRVQAPEQVHAAPASPLGALTDAYERAALGLADELPELDAGVGPLGRAPGPDRAYGDQELQVVRTRHGAIVRLDESRVELEALDHEADFALDLAPEWSGEEGRERVVYIVATPGVRVSGSDEPRATDDDMGSYGRRLRPQIIRVQDPALVARARASASIEPSAYVPARRQTAGIDPGDPERALVAAPGPSGVTVIERASGVRLRIQATDPAVGARFAYQVVSPLEHGDPHRPAEIRVLAAPGTRIEVFEPHARPPAGMPDVDSFASASVALLLYEAWNPGLIPGQGAALEPAFLEMAGERREPDARTFAPRGLEQTVATIAADTILSALPGVGEVYEVQQLARAVGTGRDLYGDPVSRAELGAMLLLVLLPLVGSKALRAARKGSGAAALRGDAELADLAARLGLRMEDVEELLIRMSAWSGEERAALGRVQRAAAAGGRFDPNDIQRVRALWSELAQELTLDLPPSALDGWGSLARSADDLGESGPELGAMHVRGRRGAGAAMAARAPGRQLDVQTRGILGELERHLGADDALVAVAEMAASMPRPEAYLRAVRRLARASEGAVRPDLVRQLVDRSAQMAEPVVFLRDSRWLIERGLSPTALENLVDKIGRGRPPDLAWLRRCTLELADLEFLAAHPETRWKSFMAASRSGSDTFPVGIATHGNDAGKAARNVAAQSRGAAGELLLESVQLPGGRTVRGRGDGYDYQLALPSGLEQGAEVKAWRPTTWARYLDAGQDSPQLQHLAKQLKAAAAENPGLPPVLVLSDAVAGKLLVRIKSVLHDLGSPDMEILQISESEIQAIGRRLRRGMGIQ